MIPLPRSFYARNTLTVAKDLLGCTLVRKVQGSRATLSGIITETECYKSSDDPASHAHNGMTQRNRAMFGTVGCAYVYFTYGMHHCLNAVAFAKNQTAGAVLIRAMMPTNGMCIMSKNRNSCSDGNIANGPAKLAQALNVTRELYGTDLTIRSALYITGKLSRNKKIIQGTRVGIRKGTERLWNFKIS